MKTVLLTNFLFYPHLGGVENSLYHLALEFRRMGIRPLIMTSNRGLRGEELPSYDEVEGMPVYRFRTRKRTGPVALLSVAEEFRESSALAARICREYPVWGVVARSHVCGLGTIASLKGIPSIYIPPGISKVQSHPGLLNRSGNPMRRAARWLSASIQLPVQHTLQRRILERAGQVYVFSEMMRQQIWEEFSFDRLEILHPGVDSRRFHMPAVRSQEPLRLANGVPPDAVVLLTVARINPSKGIDVAIEALARLPERFRLWVVGDGPDKARLEGMAAQLGLGSERIVFFPPTRKPEEFYQAADLFLMTSRYEPFGQTILEAHASGLPVVGFYQDLARGVRTATGEIVLDGETGFLTPFGADTLAETLSRYAAFSPEQRQTMQDRARSYVVAKYDWAKFCAKLVVKFEEMHRKECHCPPVS